MMRNTKLVPNLSILSIMYSLFPSLYHYLLKGVRSHTLMSRYAILSKIFFLLKFLYRVGFKLRQLILIPRIVEKRSPTLTWIWHMKKKIFKVLTSASLILIDLLIDWLIYWQSKLHLTVPITQEESKKITFLVVDLKDISGYT